MAAPTVVFDLDGTLVDTAPDLVATLNVIFAREGLPPVAYDAARNMIGGGARAMIERGLAAEGRTSRRRRSIGCCTTSSRTMPHISPTARGRSRGSTTALDELAAGGCRFAVCTNKLEGLSRALARCARPVAALRGDLRTGHVRVAETRPGAAAADDRARRRPPRPGGHGRGFRHRYRHSRAPQAFRSSRSISAIPKPQWGSWGPTGSSAPFPTCRMPYSSYCAPAAARARNGLNRCFTLSAPHLGTL